MLLQEEYLQRHKLKVPVISHVKKGAIFLHVTKGYVMMKIDWQDSERHPGSYVISYHSPIHDGYNRGTYWHNIPKVERELQWDEYQYYFASWAKGDLHPVSERKLVVLTGWQIFILCADSALARLSDARLEKLIFASVDPDKPIENQFTNYQQAVAYLCTQHPALLRAYTRNIVPHLECYCYWLADLIKNEHTK